MHSSLCLGYLGAEKKRDQQGTYKIARCWWSHRPASDDKRPHRDVPSKRSCRNFSQNLLPIFVVYSEVATQPSTIPLAIAQRTWGNLEAMRSPSRWAQARVRGHQGRTMRKHPFVWLGLGLAPWTRNQESASRPVSGRPVHRSPCS